MDEAEALPCTKHPCTLPPAARPLWELPSPAPPCTCFGPSEGLGVLGRPCLPELQSGGGGVGQSELTNTLQMVSEGDVRWEENNTKRGQGQAGLRDELNQVVRSVHTELRPQSQGQECMGDLGRDHYSMAREQHGVGKGPGAAITSPSLVLHSSQV